MCNGLFGGNYCTWIVILLVLILINDSNGNLFNSNCNNGCQNASNCGCGCM